MSASLIFFRDRVFGRSIRIIGRSIRINRRDQIKNQSPISLLFPHCSSNTVTGPVLFVMERPEMDYRVGLTEPDCRRSAVPVSVTRFRVGFVPPVPQSLPLVPVALLAFRDQGLEVGEVLLVPKICRPLCPRHHVKVRTVRAKLPQDPLLLKVKDLSPFVSQKIIRMDSDLEANKL